MSKKFKFKCPKGCKDARVEQIMLGVDSEALVLEGFDGDGDFLYGSPILSGDHFTRYQCSVCDKYVADSEEGLMKTAEKKGWIVDDDDQRFERGCDG